MLALDVCGEPTSSRSRSSQAYAERMGGIGPDEAGGTGGGSVCALYGVYLAVGSGSYVSAFRE